MSAHVKHRCGRPPSPPIEGWLTAGELAEVLGASRGFVYALAHDKSFPTPKNLYGCRRWPADQIGAFVGSREVSAKTRKPTTAARSARVRLRKLIRSGS